MSTTITLALCLPPVALCVAAGWYGFMLALHLRAVLPASLLGGVA